MKKYFTYDLMTEGEADQRGTPTAVYVAEEVDAARMTEERALKILAHYGGVPYTWIDADYASLDAAPYSKDELEAILWWMKNSEQLRPKFSARIQLINKGGRPVLDPAEARMEHDEGRTHLLADWTVPVAIRLDVVLAKLILPSQEVLLVTFKYSSQLNPGNTFTLKMPLTSDERDLLLEAAKLEAAK